MNCQEACKLLDGYSDSELPLPQNHAMDQHLRACASCQTQYERLTALRDALHHSGHFTPPHDLRGTIYAQLQTLEQDTPQRAWFEPWLKFGSPSFALGAACVWLLSLFVVLPMTPTPLGGEIVAAHIRSLMVDHATDIRSSDQHKVKPWFSGRLGFSPSVVDLESKGYALSGARLEYLDYKTAAALVYTRREHIINLFIWPQTDRADRDYAITAQQGYNLVSWSASGFNYWAASDLNQKELTQFAILAGATPQ